MRYKRGFTIIELFSIIAVLCVVVSWAWNATKFFSCDFEESYKCEIVHGVGIVVPPLSLVAVWFADDSEVEK
jgi:hypothetical protein